MAKTISEFELITREAAREALKMFKKEQKENERKSILHNTEVLLNRYHDVKDYIQTAKLRTKVMDEEVILRSILRNKIISKLLIEHIDECFNKLSMKFPEEYPVLEIMYLNENTYSLSWDVKINRVAAELNISNSTVARWRRKMINEMSIFLFGADGIKLWTL